MGFDPYDPSFLRDPYPTYRRLRAGSPFYDERWGLTFFARYDDVVGILRDRRFGRDVRHAVPPEEVDRAVYERIYPSRYPNWTRFIRDSFIDLEPPRHTRIRRLVQWAFSRRASESYRERMQVTADRLIGRALEAGRMEAIADYATPIPLTMIAELLGIPEPDQPQLLAWSHAIVRLFDQGCTASEAERAEEATIEFADYVRGLLAERRRRPGDDLVSSLVAAEVDGDRLSEDELVATCILTLNAGHEATVQAIGNGILALARHPDAFAWLRRHPEAVGTAIEELLRFDTPLQMFERWVLEDLEWASTPLRRGTKVGLLLGSANRDEHHFPNPDTLDLGRHPNDHVSFGAGIHFCVGAPLARVELDVAIGTLARRVGRLEPPPDEPERAPSLVFRGVQALPVGLTPA